jgi:hypothetical protein
MELALLFVMEFCYLKNGILCNSRVSPDLCIIHSTSHLNKKYFHPHSAFIIIFSVKLMPNMRLLACELLVFSGNW